MEKYTLQHTVGAPTTQVFADDEQVQYAAAATAGMAYGIVRVTGADGRMVWTLLDGIEHRWYVTDYDSFVVWCVESGDVPHQEYAFVPNHNGQFPYCPCCGALIPERINA